MPKYKRILVKPVRYMVLHTNAEHPNRLEWRDAEEVIPHQVAVLKKNKLNKTKGDYCAIKF